MSARQTASIRCPPPERLPAAAVASNDELERLYTPLDRQERPESPAPPARLDTIRPKD